MINIKLNLKKVMLLVLAFTACNSQASWSDWGRVFSFNKDSKVGIALQTYQPKVAIAAVATCVTVCALAALAWNKYKSWGVSQIVQPVPGDTEKSDLSDHVVSSLTKPFETKTKPFETKTKPFETKNKPLETDTNLNLPSSVGCGAVNNSIYNDFTRTDVEYEGADSIYDDHRYDSEDERRINDLFATVPTPALSVPQKTAAVYGLVAARGAGPLLDVIDVEYCTHDYTDDYAIDVLDVETLDFIDYKASKNIFANTAFKYTAYFNKSRIRWVVFQHDESGEITAARYYDKECKTLVSLDSMVVRNIREIKSIQELGSNSETYDLKIFVNGMNIFGKGL